MSDITRTFDLNSSSALGLSSSWGQHYAHECFSQQVARDVVLTKKVWERIQKIAILKQLPNHFKAKCEKGVGTLFPLHYTPACS